MSYYRLYFLEANHIRHVVELDCDSDELAIGHVSKHADGRAMELWEGNRLMKRFVAEPPLAARSGYWLSLPSGGNPTISLA